MVEDAPFRARFRRFDVNCDNRLLYCKGPRLVEVIREHLTDLAVGDGLVMPDVPRDVRFSLESGGQESFGPWSFHEVPRIWAPVVDNLPGLQRKDPVCLSLQFSLMGQKLFISQDQVSVGQKPVTGLRLCLEGSKQSQLCIQIQHLATLPKILLPYWDTHVAIGAPKWQGPEEQDSRWFEPVNWKNFSHVCTAPVENNETLVSDPSGVYIVTGAQLRVWDFGSRNVLYMKLLYSKVPRCTTRRSLWDTNGTVGSTVGKLKRLPSDDSLTAGGASSGLGDEGKLTKFVDISEKVKGPDNIPGHWLVTGAKLGVEKGKIVLRLKYSLLNY